MTKTFRTGAALAALLFAGLMSFGTPASAAEYNRGGGGQQHYSGGSGYGGSGYGGSGYGGSSYGGSGYDRGGQGSHNFRGDRGGQGRDFHRGRWERGRHFDRRDFGHRRGFHRGWRARYDHRGPRRGHFHRW